MSNQKFVLSMICLVFGFCVLVISINYRVWPWQRSHDLQNSCGTSIAKIVIANFVISKIESAHDSKVDLPTGREWVGGVPRPKSDLIDGTYRPKANYPNPTIRNGKVPLVNPLKNQSTRLIRDAAQNGDHPQRLSYFSKPKPFDLEKFRSDPDSYLNDVEPGRVMQTSRISPDVEPIKRKGSYFSVLLQGETISLKAIVKPLMPVTFYSPHVGQFQNSLSTITVRADETGLAEAQFTAVKGTSGDIDILAASPVHSHQVRYLVRVEIPQPPPELERHE